MANQWLVVTLIPAMCASMSSFPPAHRREETPVDEALRRSFSETLAVIRARTAPETDVTGTKEVDEFDEGTEQAESKA